MPLRISCPEGHTLVVSQARAGSTLRCPKCSSPIVVPPSAPVRHAALVDKALSALSPDSGKSSTAAVIEGEPEPPPVVVPPAEVTPPPIWSPPPKSRAIVDPQPESKGERQPEPIPIPDSCAAQAPCPEPAPEPVDLVETRETIARPIQPEIVAEVTEIPLPVSETAQDSLPRREDRAAASEASPESTPEPAADVPPLTPNAGQQLAAYALSLSLVAAALFGAAPAIWDLIQVAQAAENAFVPRWALMLIAAGVVQIAYAVYLAQMPDWTSGWIVTLVTLVLAALYAGMLGITLLAGEESLLVRGLDLGEIVPTGRAAMWCLCMTSVLTTLAYFGGRTSFRWRAAERTQAGTCG